MKVQPVAQTQVGHVLHDFLSTYTDACENFRTNTARHLHPQAERVHMQGVLLAIDSMGEKFSMVRNTSLRLKQHTGSHWKPQMASKVVALKTVSTL